MARHIDADVLVNELLTENQKCITSTGHELTMNMIVSFINYQPIVFDKEKVIAELEEFKINGTNLDNADYKWNLALVYAIEVVRKGGIDGKDR